MEVEICVYMKVKFLGYRIEFFDQFFMHTLVRKGTVR